MENIVDVNEIIYEYLEEIKDEQSSSDKPFLYTLRRSNQKNRLEEGYWFYGNENYLAVSFWSGMDWKNKTPNIFFRVTEEGTTYLTITSKDSIVKSEKFRSFFIKILDLKKDGQDRWSKQYSQRDYLQSLQYFLRNDKVIIDEIITSNYNALDSEDKGNRIGFINQSDFDNWLENVRKYRDEDGETKIPFSLVSLTVENYTPIIKTSFGRISKNVPFIFLVGENGSGKSSLLKAIATSTGNKFYERGYEPDNTSWLINYSLNVQGKTKRYKITNHDPRAREGKDIPFAGYGASRLIIDNRAIRSTINEAGKDKTAPLWSLFFPDAILKDINRWLINQLASTNKGSDKDRAKLRFENIKQMLITIIPNVYDIREVPWDNTQELLYFEEDLRGNKIEKGVIFEHLSSGLRSLLAMLGDMMLRLFDQQPGQTDPAALEGIVLIDEIDIHLHPKWQKALPQILHECFPKIQFIVTTHSPIPLLGAPKKSRIYVVKRDADTGVSIERMDDKVMFSEILPNAILTSPIFGLADITPVSKDDEKQTNVEDNYKDISLYNKIEKDIKAFLTNEKQKELINLFKKEK
jgi:predicted ATP-binding protein involved in virulence